MSAAQWQLLCEILAGLCGVLFFAICIIAARLRKLAARLDDEMFRRQSLSTTYGRITEQCLTVSKLNLTEKGMAAI